MRQPQRILPHILLRVLPAFILILLVIWFSARTMANRALQREVNERLATQAKQAAQATAKKLNTLVDTVKGLSVNNLIINGLIDTGDRANYLPTFFQSLRIPGPIDVTIAMTDYRGHHIVTNTGETISYTNAPWLDTVMAGNHHFEISANGLQIAMPILYSGLPEGVLTISYNPADIPKILALTSRTSAFAILDKSEFVLFSTDAALGNVGGPYDETKHEKWIKKREPVPGITGLYLICAEPYQQAFGASKRLDQYLLLAMIFNLLALVAGVFLSAQLTAKPLSGIIKKINQVTDTCELDCNIPEVGAHEFQLLAKSFNNMLKDLQKTTVSRNDLELLVRERTLELEKAQNELVSNAMDAGRAQYAAMIIHNIGNAITPITAQIDDLKRTELEQISRYLEKCYSELKDNFHDLKHFLSEDARGKEVFLYMGSLINHLKAYSKERQIVLNKIEEAVTYISEILSLQYASATVNKKAKQQIDLNALIEDAVHMQLGALEKRKISVRRDLAANMPKLLIDKNSLMQVLVNLIKNSYEALGAVKDGAEKVIRLHSFSEKGCVGFEITDNGIGIEVEQIDTITELGKSQKGSTGVGLFYCKMFVETNKGALKITSPGKDKGTTVRVEFEI
jgi:signal transduction histidine kinase